MASVFATLAYEWAGRPNRYPDQLVDGLQPHQTQKLYYTTSDFSLPDRPPISPSPITTVIDITNHLVAKVAAFEAHTTQAPVFPLVKETILTRSPQEMFHLAATSHPRRVAEETDLLEGVETPIAKTA
jgi:LmbE family N-acetylglucosaminyl deacetylase